MKEVKGLFIAEKVTSNKKNIIIVSFDHHKSNIPLQPWKYIHELAKHCASNGNEVCVLTNGSVEEDLIEGVKVKGIGAISPFNSNVLENIRTLHPSEVYWWASLRSFAYLKHFNKLDCKINLMFTGSIYKASEIFPVLLKIGRRNILNFLIEALTPLLFLTKLINHKKINKTLVLSSRNKERLVAKGCLPSKVVVTGIGKEIFGDEEKIRIEIEKEDHVLYLTSATKIRGIETLLESIAIIKKSRPKIRLKILARPGSGNDIDFVNEVVKKLRIEENVSIVEGWLKKSEILIELAKSKILIMPFLIVHSEMPISIIESFSVGTPVIVPDIDGLPELVYGKGSVYSGNSPENLSSSILQILSDNALYQKYSQDSNLYWNTLPLWKDLFSQHITID